MCNICYTLYMNLLSLLTTNELNLLKIKKYQQNEIIFHENDLCNYVFFIIKGKIKIVTYSLNGNEEILSTHKDNDLFGNALIFSKKPFFLGNVICKTNTTIAYLQKQDLIKIMQTNQEFLINYINVLSEKTINLNIKNKLLAHKNIRTRIIYFLEINHNIYQKNVSLIARELILPRPSVSREIQKMLNENIIKKDEKYFYLI